MQFEYNQEALKNLKIEDTSILDRLVDYRSAREAHQKKNHSQKDKRISLQEAVSEYVNDGDVWADTGFGYVRTSIQSMWEMVRQGKKDLQAIGSPNTNQSYTGPYGTMPFVHTSYAGAEMRGYDKYYSRSIKNGTKKILSDWSHGLMAQGFKAAQLGLPGVFSKQGLLSDIVKHNPYLKVMQNPMAKDNDPVIFVPALFPDVTFIHVNAADKYGNARFLGPAVNDIALAAASRKVIITTEEIVSNTDIRWNNKGVSIPFNNVDAVVELPFGAAPGYMPGCYYWGRRFWEKFFVWAAEDDDRVKEYFDSWIFETGGVTGVVEKLGGITWIQESRKLARAAEGDNEFDSKFFDYELWHEGLGDIYS
jgi:glutaconate CoA-transferase, subunit A